MASKGGEMKEIEVEVDEFFVVVLDMFFYDKSRQFDAFVTVFEPKFWGRLRQDSMSLWCGKYG